MTNPNQWPIGAKVKTIVPLMGTIETGRDEMGLVTTAPSIVVQAGSVGVVEDHYDDGRILVTFECDTLRGHTFAKPERYLELTDESQPNAYDMIERLTRMQIVPMTSIEYYASQETIKAAIRVIGEQIDEIERLQAERRWIPVTERLPEGNNYVMVYSPKAGKACYGFYAKETGRWILDRGHWGNDETVTHWQPLPEGPEAE